MKELLKKVFINYTKRYGLKETRFENILGWVYIAGMLCAVVGTLRSAGGSKNQIFWCAIVWMCLWLQSMLSKNSLYRRITELGGDINHKENKSEPKESK
jgi:hypothetical protein